MDRQLSAAPLIRPLGSPSKLSSADTYTQLSNFIINLPPSPARTQIERLADALGVEVGAIAPSEGDRREADRIAKRLAAKRRKKEEEEARRAEEMEGMVEGLDAHIEGDEKEEEDDNKDDGDAAGEGMEEGGVDFEGPGEVGVAARGDVEYGDDLEEEDEDEPDNDNEAERMEQDQSD